MTISERMIYRETASVSGEVKIDAERGNADSPWLRSSLVG
jgi:hypothetical protein